MKPRKKRLPGMLRLLQEEKAPKTEGLGKELHRIHGKGKVKKEVKELAMLAALITAAVGGRVLFQYVPSVEPIIPLAILAGLLFGIKEGAVAGSTAYLISNFFVWGLQGPWTIFMALGGGIAGAMGGVAGRFVTPSLRALMLLTVAGTVFYELLMNLAGGLMGIGLTAGLIGLPLYFLLSVPFSVTHIVTNLGFALLMKPLLKLKRKKDEVKILSYTRRDDAGHHTVRMYSANE